MDANLMCIAGMIGSFGAMTVTAFRDKKHANARIIVEALSFIGFLAATCFTFKPETLESHSEQSAEEKSAQTYLMPEQKNIQKANKIERVNVASQPDKVLSFHLRQFKSNTRV